MRAIYQDVRVCGNRIYLCLLHGEWGGIIKGTALTLLSDKIWNEEWEQRRNQFFFPKKRYWRTRFRGWRYRLFRKTMLLYRIRTWFWINWIFEKNRMKREIFYWIWKFLKTIMGE